MLVLSALKKTKKHFLPILIVEETDNDDSSTSVAPKLVQPTGPPVKAAQTRLTVFQVYTMYMDIQSRFFLKYYMQLYHVDYSITGWRAT